MAGKRLRPHAEGAKRRAAARTVKGDERIQKERDIVAFDLEVALVDVRCERQGVQLFRVQLRPGPVVNDFAVFFVTRVKNLTHRLAMGILRHRVVEFSAHDEVDVLAGVQGLIWLDVPVRADERHLHGGVRFLDLAQ